MLEESMTMGEKKPADSRGTFERRGLIAAAWAAVVALVMKETTQPVHAAASLQFQNLASATTVENVAQGPTAIYSANTYQSTGAVFTGQAFEGGALCGVEGVAGTRTVPYLRSGVFGDNLYVDATGAGVFGQNQGGSGYGVLGRSGNAQGYYGGIGVQGESGFGIGVRGMIPALNYGNQSAIAVYGLNNSNYAGPGPGAGGFGVYGLSAKGHGLVGATAAAGGAAVVGATNGVAGAYAGAFYGPVLVGGDFTVFGAKSAAVPHPDGSRRRLYCVESPESWFEDFGRAELECGRAEVAIDPDFAAIADLRDYDVFLTGYGANHHLFVKTRTPAGFSVEADATIAALKGVKANEITGAFSWRVVAKRKDIEGPRLERVETPPPPVCPDLPPPV
jgi:hypothetical protein